MTKHRQSIIIYYYAKKRHGKGKGKVKGKVQCLL